jgi:hypothetical protein
MTRQEDTLGIEFSGGNPIEQDRDTPSHILNCSRMLTRWHQPMSKNRDGMTGLSNPGTNDLAIRRSGWRSRQKRL